MDPIVLSTHLCNKRFTITSILILLNVRVHVCFLLELLRWHNILHHVKLWTGILLFIRQFNCISNSTFTRGFGARETQTLPPRSLFPCKLLTVSFIHSFLFYNLIGKKPLIISFLFLYKIDNSAVILHTLHYLFIKKEREPNRWDSRHCGAWQGSDVRSLTPASRENTRPTLM